MARFLALLALLAMLTVLASPALAIPTTVRDDEKEMPSESPEESEEPEESPEVCIDIAHLSSVPAGDLVHAEHLTATALCPADSSLPCGTADHMVRVAGVPMSYRAFCASDGVTCVKKEMQVNSVLSHLWREEVHSHAGRDVVLTMFDDRHPELVQKVLHRMFAFRRSVARMFV